MKLSIVCQGPVLPYTKTAIESYRTHFPDTEVILSTWKGQDLTGLDPDALVLMSDPGPGGMKNNIGRQIVGSLAGIRIASSPLVMRIRSDGIFLSPGCLEHWGKYPKRADDFKIFKERLIVPNVGTCDPDVHVSLQVTEWAILGLKEDLEFLYDIPAFGPADVTQKSLEQYLYVSAIQKKMPEIDIPYLTFNDDNLRQQTRQFMANNVVVLDTRRQYSMYCGKWEHVPDDELVTMKHAKWLSWYDALIQPGVPK